MPILESMYLEVDMNIPNDPMMLLSFVNTQLRDNYPSLDEFVKVYGCDKAMVVAKLRDIDYEYDEALNKFV